MLYEQGEKKKLEMEEKRKQIKEEQAKKQKEEYSFHPKINENQITAEPKLNKEVKNGVKKVIDRTSAWAQAKENKIKMLKEEREKQELNNCTFQPVLVTNGTKKVTERINENDEMNEFNIASIKSVDKYIEKQKLLRVQKEEQKKKAEQSIGSGNLWNKKITVPKAPNFTAKPKTASNSKAEPLKHHKMYPKSDEESKNSKTNKIIENIVFFNEI